MELPAGQGVRGYDSVLAWGAPRLLSPSVSGRDAKNGEEEAQQEMTL